MLDTTLGALDGLPLSTYDGTDLEYLEGSTDGTAYDNLEGLLLGS